jgi:NTE family protein
MIVATCLVVAVTGSGWAQEAKRPKIGLVLGGGGARGAAHVGILKVLEENRVPVDFVVGTSMGSIVGGLFALGNSPAQIDQKFHEIPWTELFADWPSQDWLSFRRKRDQERFIDIEFGASFKKGLRMPRGFIAGQKLGFELKNHTLKASAVTDFDKLAFPFRAVSADINTGEVVVHNQGNVADAIRASMSLPGVFPPVELDGRILIDGGIVNNVPVDVARKMGADVVIAIDVGTPLGTVTPDSSVLSFFNQFLGVVTEDNVRKSKAMITERDLLIRPELGDITSGSFERVYDAIAIGERTAREMVAQIRKFSVSEAEYQLFLKQRESFQPPKPVVSFVRIEGCKEVNPELVKAKLRIEPGAELSVEDFKAGVTRVYTMGDFEVVDFRIKEEQGKLGAVVTVKEKPWGPDYLRFGLNLATDFSAGSSYNILFEHRKSNMNRLGAEWKNMLEIGATRGLTSTWYQPLDRADRFFVEPSLTLKDNRRDVYFEGDLVGVYSTSYWNVGIKTGMNFGTSSQLRAELNLGQGDAKPDSQNEGLELPVYNNTDRTTVTAAYEIDTFDNHNMPHQGTRLKAIWQSSLEALGADYAYDKASLSYTKATTFAGRHTIIAGLSGGITLDEDAPYFDQFQLGGLFKLSGLADQQLIGQNVVSGELLYYTNLSKSLHVGCGLETGSIWNDRSEAEFDDLLWGGVVFAGLETFMGPVYLAYGFTEGENTGRLRFALGKNF